MHKATILKPILR